MPYTACYSSSATVAWHTSFINNNAQQVETLVQECLDSSVDKLKMLPDSRLALALEDFVEKQVSTCVCIYYLHMLIHRLHLLLGSDCMRHVESCCEFTAHAGCAAAAVFYYHS
jgi:hypothetical protein